MALHHPVAGDRAGHGERAGEGAEGLLVVRGDEQQVLVMRAGGLGGEAQVADGAEVVRERLRRDVVGLPGDPDGALGGLDRVVDAIDVIAHETGKSVPQIALNWLLQRPSVATVIMGARNEEQLRDNLGAVAWTLTSDHMAALDKASATTPVYPYWHQRGFADRNPPPV